MLVTKKPITDPDISEMGTMPIEDFLENEGDYEVDPSAAISGDVVVSVQDEGLSQEGYFSGEVVISSSQY